MSTVIEKHVLHTNTKSFTYHESVQIGDIIPLVVDFNDDAIIGRAKVFWSADGTKLLADLFIDKAVPYLCDPPLALVATQDADVFESEDGTTYAIGGLMAQVSMLTEDGRDNFYNSPIDDEKEPPA